MSQRAIHTSLLLTWFLAACAPSTPMAPPLPSPVAIVSTASAPPTQPTALFVPATYRDEVHGFEIDYPSDWSVDPDTQVGTRGSQAQLFSPGTTAEMLAEGGSRLSIVILDWDPQGDLGAFVAQRRLAWDASEFEVRDGSLRQLVDGRPASDFFIQSPGGELAYFMLTTNGTQYLQLAGEGDLGLLESVVRTLRPLDYQPQ
jgi:hypothetical protein